MGGASCVVAASKRFKQKKYTLKSQEISNIVQYNRVKSFNFNLKQKGEDIVRLLNSPNYGNLNVPDSIKALGEVVFKAP